MQLHHLRIEAFGPFAAETVVDFDELTESGLFLLTGPTGAGKSSVLDAVCFGLYGVVPGARHAARQLRSDHAAAETAPRVELEFSVGERRFLIQRSPAWQRPKRRGGGLTPQPAKVVFEEKVDDTWVPLSTRIDEVGDLVTGLLGMHSGQFTQVTMLPQGEFQQFLTARTDDRQAILQRLFRTDRFEAVERWLRERRLATTRESEAHASEVRGLLARLAEASGSSAAVFADDDLTTSARSGAITDASQLMHDRATTELAQMRSAAEAAAKAADQADAAHAEAQRTSALLERGKRAQEVLEALTDSEDDATSQRRRLADHLRAQPALALGREHARSSAQLVECRAESTRRLAALGLAATTTSAQAKTRLGRVRRKLAAVEDFAPRDRVLTEATGQRDKLTQDLVSARSEVERLIAEHESFPHRRAELDEAVIQARLAEGRLHSRRIRVETAQSALAAAEELLDVNQALTSRRTELSAAVDHHQDLRERHLTLREARIESMAGELAASLTAGCSCPVCGSQSHPAPAVHSVLVGREQEDAARTAVDDAAIAVEAVRDAVHTLQHRFDVLTEATQGQDSAHWAAQLDTATADLKTDLTLAERLPDLTEESNALDLMETQSQRRVVSCREQVIALDEQLKSIESTVNELIHERDQVLHGLEADDIHLALRQLTDEADDLDALLECLAEAEAAAAAEQRAAAAVLVEAEAAGFADWPAVEAAALNETDQVALEAALLERERQHATASATLAEADIQAALVGPRPALASLAEAKARAADIRDRALADRSRLELAVCRLSGLHEELQTAVQRWLPVLTALDTVTSVAELAEGRGDQSVRMRLSAYVLSERLRAVVDAANDRLVHMGRDRFTLEQTDEASGRDRRGGLGLRVRDAWTSTQREVGTLSGGETFVVSLALALGLADTVTAESGGTRIETLFVDEGFGSLDSESLDAVLDTLDSLREGGRAVGVVSHVTEMRERIPTQLRVTNSRERGSRLELVVA